MAEAFLFQGIFSNFLILFPNFTLRERAWIRDEGLLKLRGIPLQCSQHTNVKSDLVTSKDSWLTCLVTSKDSRLTCLVTSKDSRLTCLVNSTLGSHVS